MARTGRVAALACPACQRCVLQGTWTDVPSLPGPTYPTALVPSQECFLLKKGPRLFALQTSDFAPSSSQSSHQ